MAQYEYEDNYLALAVSILGNCIPEMAFKVLGDGKGLDFRNVDLTQEDIGDIKIFREQGLTFKAIGEIYCMKSDAIYGRLRKKPDKKVSQSHGPTKAD